MLLKSKNNRNRIIELHKKTIDDKNKLKIQADFI